MKRFLVLAGFSLLAKFSLAAGNQTALTVSSGTYQTVDMYSNADGSNRQAIVIGDFSSSDTLRVDPVTGIAVHLATSTAIAGAFQPIGITTVTFNGTAQPIQNASGGALAIISSKAITVDGSGVTQPISGTVSVQNTSNGALAIISSKAITVDGSGVTQPISGTVGITGFPLVPTGANASTSAVVNQAGQALAIISTTTLNVSGSFSANGSSITIFAPNNNTTAIPVTGSFSASSVNLSTYTYGGTLGSIGTAIGGIGPGGNFQTFAVDSSSQVKVTGSFSASTVLASTAVTGGTPPGVVEMIGTEDGAGKAQKVGYGTNDSSVPVNVINTPAVSQSGTWNIGTVTAVTAISNALPVGTNNIGTISGSTVTAVFGGANSLPSGTNTIGTVNAQNVTNTALAVISSTTLNVQGALSNNGAAATSNRVAMLPGIAQSVFGNNGSAYTTGRDAAALILSSSGLMGVSIQEDNTIPTYSASTTTFAVINSTTDITELCGNGTNTITVTDLRLSCTQTTAGIVPVQIVYRSSAYSGTWSTVTYHKDDSQYAVPRSSAVFGNVNGFTNGTLSDYLDNAQIGCMASATTAPNDVYISPSSWRQHGMILRGTGQCIGVNTGGTSVSGNKWTVTWRWKEYVGP